MEVYDCTQFFLFFKKRDSVIYPDTPRQEIKLVKAPTVYGIMYKIIFQGSYLDPCELY